MKKLPVFVLILATILTGFLFLRQSNKASAATTHIVISEIQIAGGTSTDEFVELYNPTTSYIDISGWSLYRKTAAQVSQTLVATASGNIPPHGFYLFAGSGFDAGITPDKLYSENISSDNTVLLRNSSNNLVDLVGLGTANTKEGTTVDNPIANRSVERKANSSSTEVSMALGGTDELSGNGEDTDNNSVDFVKHVSPHLSNPQNSSSTPEPGLETPTPSVTPTLTLTPTLTPSETPSETLSPSPTPSETPTPILEPTATPTVTPTLEPTSSPTPTITPTPIISVTPTLSPSPTPTPSGQVILTSPHLVCTLTQRSINFFFFQINLPVITCFKI